MLVKFCLLKKLHRNFYAIFRWGVEQGNNKENIKASHYWSFAMGIHRWQLMVTQFNRDDNRSFDALKCRDTLNSDLFRINVDVNNMSITNIIWYVNASLQ